MYLNYSPNKIHSFLSKSGFILEKKFKFPFHRIEDRLYVLNNKMIYKIKILLN